MGTKEAQFMYPRGVAISNDGQILVTNEHRLLKLTFEVVCVKSLGNSSSGSGQLQLNSPTGITIHPISQHIFVADSYNNHVQVFHNDLTFSHTIGHKLNRPSDVHDH